MDESDPRAEIDRLCAPDGPWLHLLDGAPADARQLGWLLAERGVMTRQLRGQCMRTRYALYDEVGAALQLPGEPAEDWAGFAAPLVDLDWLRTPGGPAAAAHVLVVVAASLTLVAEPGEFAAFCAALVKAAQRRTVEVEVGVPVPLHVVLADDAVGLVTLRARLKAAGTEFGELTGWRAEEPSVVRGRGVRSAFVAGAPAAALDERAVAALEGCGEVLEIRRSYEEFRGAATTRTPVYAAVVDRFERVDELTERLAGAVAEDGGQVLVISDIEAARSPRQRDFMADSTAIWPAPPEPEVVSSAPDGAASDGAFEIVAANLEWEFQRGGADRDPVDEAVVAATDSGLTGVWRCWCHDPRRERWVRVVLALTAEASAADAVRRLLVDTLEGAGAARCCVEVVGAGDAGDAHRWLQQQSVRLVGEDPPAEMEAVTDEAEAQEPEPEPEPERQPEQEQELEPEPQPQPEPESQPEPEPELTFQPGPAEPDPAGARLVAWAEADERVAGLISAYTQEQRLTYGVVVAEGEHDLTDVTEAAAAALADDGPLLVVFAPSGRLDPMHLRLYRGGTRLWRRRTARELAAASDRVDTTPADPIIDRTLPNGVTVMGVGAANTLDRGGPTPDDIDKDVVSWAESTEHVIAVMRCVSNDPAGGVPFVVYGVATDALTDGAGIAEAVAGIVSDHGLRRCGVQVFCPFGGGMSLFDMKVFRSALQLWRTDADLTPEQRGQTPDVEPEPA